MTATPWPPAAPEVAYFRDPAGTWFAAEVVRADAWSDLFRVPPDRDVADIRLLFVPGGRRAEGAAPWLVALDPSLEAEPGRVVAAAQAAWLASPFHREAGDTPEAYLVAGYQALCPPHPPCDVGPDARDSLAEFLRERPEPLGSLANEGRDGFNRRVRLHWATPQDFAEHLLRERIRDDGAARVLDLIEFLEHAPVDADAGSCAALEAERQALLGRLRPERFFTAARDFDGAVAAAREWAAKYDRAYRQHYRAVMEMACDVLREIAPALAAAGELDSMNRDGRAVGAEAVRRLAAAATELRSLPEAPLPGVPVTRGITAGGMPPAITEARLAAAAVLAALEVQRRRHASIAPPPR